ncbi:MAG: hypothetical protein VKN83_08480 [Cyanobacteriota bacterium]|nr:hypothetical protein [Cyanobacteriota bacterium]
MKTTLGKVRRSAGRLRHRWSLPYASFSKLPAGGSVSDLFLWRGDIEGTRFIAENTLALLTAEPIEVIHRLTFFNVDGGPFYEYEISTRAPYKTIEPGDIGLALGTFIHATFYDSGSLSADARKLLDLQRAHRGYCQYRRQKDSVWSSVHGNLGGITSTADRHSHSHGLLARSRRQFLYTPQYHVHAEQHVTLFFLNPCRKDVAISIFRCCSEKESGPSEALQTLHVPSLGVRSWEVTGLEGYVTCQSKLPMCRPIIFIQDAYSLHHFDVFHT